MGKVYKTDPETFENIAEILKALGHPQRLCIAKTLCEEGEHTVSDMQHCMEEKQPVISKYLMTLKAANIIKGKREGNKIYYSISSEKMKNLIEVISKEFIE